MKAVRQLNKLTARESKKERVLQETGFKVGLKNWQDDYGHLPLIFENLLNIQILKYTKGNVKLLSSV